MQLSQIISYYVIQNTGTGNDDSKSPSAHGYTFVKPQKDIELAWYNISRAALLNQQTKFRFCSKF